MDEADALNDDTFGAPVAPRGNLPAFFQTGAPDTGDDDFLELPEGPEHPDTGLEDELNDLTFGDDQPADDNSLPAFFQAQSNNAASFLPPGASLQPPPAANAATSPRPAASLQNASKLSLADLGFGRPAQPQQQQQQQQYAAQHSGQHARAQSEPAARPSHPGQQPPHHHAQHSMPAMPPGMQQVPMVMGPDGQLRPAFHLMGAPRPGMPMPMPMPMGSPMHPHMAPRGPVPHQQFQHPPRHFQQPGPHTRGPPMQPRGPLMQPRGPPTPAQYIPVPRVGKYMKERDVRFILGNLAKTLNISNPYDDDYYYMQSVLKLHQSHVKNALEKGAHPPPPPALPMPAWRELKERFQQQNAEMRMQTNERIRQWEEDNQVLGHCVKSVPSRPKEVLVIDQADLEDTDDADERTRGYASTLWATRKAITRGFEALHTVQELDILLTHGAGLGPMRNELVVEMEEAKKLLGQSLGVQYGAQERVISDGGLIAAILQLPKGQRLLARGFQILPVDQRWALLQVILARILQKRPPEDEEGRAVEAKLMETLLAFVNWPENPATLAQVKQCLKSVMISHMEKNILKEALSLRSRAEVLQAVLQKGEAIAADEAAKGEDTSDWIQLRQAFMDMIDASS